MSLPLLRPVGTDVSVCAQIDVDALTSLAQAGFRSVINNRPDGEGGPDQPTSAALQAAAHAAGLAYAHLPVSPSVQTDDEATRMRTLLDTLPRPIVAFCRSGTRSGKLYDKAMSV
jgi:uncharacterized protein (TIGR01244 family)